MSQESTFFKLIFGPDVTGFVSLALLVDGDFSEKFFEYPSQLDDMVTFVSKYRLTHNIYFCPQLFSKPKRKKDNVVSCYCAWADLDTCSPDEVQKAPTITVESSPGRWQAYWVFEEPVEPFDAESLSKRIAYFHADQGCDRSGWDLTQLLRVPFTFNFKPEYGKQPPEVKIISAKRLKYRLEDFISYPAVAGITAEEFELPKDLPESSGEDILSRYIEGLPDSAWYYFQNVPEDDWSKPLWSLEMICFEVGMSREEAYLVARDAACNKYRRDNRPEGNLWKDVCRSYVRHQENKKLLSPIKKAQSALLSDAERTSIDGTSSFVDRYIKWASGLGDAAVQYHTGGAFVVLSSLLAGSVRLPTSFGTIKPNIWFMILADTTMTRKSTAMDIATDLLADVDSSALLATDGSIEGLLQGLSTRPGQPSLFLRDEFSGFLEMMVKKDYYAGMAETLTKLYDGKLQKRVLRKETLEIKDPALILFTGGIKNKVTSLLTHEYVSSGFIPRFVFITAESTTDTIKPIGPPSLQDDTMRDALVRELRDMQSHYHSDPSMVMDNGKMIMKTAPGYRAFLSESVWLRYNELEMAMMRAALASNMPDVMTPTYDRLCKSGLKVATLLAAADQRPGMGELVEVTMKHLLKAIAYVEEWRIYGNGVIEEVGTTTNERLLQRIYSAISKQPGITRGILMQNFHLNARETTQLFDTLEQRGLVSRVKRGKAEVLEAVGSPK